MLGFVFLEVCVLWVGANLCIVCEDFCVCVEGIVCNMCACESDGFGYLYTFSNVLGMYVL